MTKKRGKPAASLQLPTIRVGGKQYVEREHFDIAFYAAQNNQHCVIEMQKERDEWRNKYLAIVHSKGKRR